MTIASLQINDGFTTYPIELHERFVVTKVIEVPGRPWPRRLGYRQWQVGDQGSVHLDAPLHWILIEVRITQVLSRSIYRGIITKFDGSLTQLADLCIGDYLMIEDHHFFSLWAPDKTCEEDEGAQRLHEEGSTRPTDAETGQ